MKSYITRTIATTVIMIAASVIYVNAQSAHRVTADIPFDFFIGKEMMPAGTYEFEVANRHAYPGALIVRSTIPGANHSFIVPALLDKATKGAEPSIMFNRYGAAYFFANINADSGSMAFKVWKSDTEKRLAREAREVVPVKIQPTETARR